MKQLPATERALCVRTDFSDDDKWKSVCASFQELPAEDLMTYGEIVKLYAAIGQHVDPPRCDLELIDDPAYANISLDELLKLIPQPPSHPVLIVVDAKAISHADHPVLIVDVDQEPGRSFRAIPSQVDSIENNLWIANLDWEDFADHVDAQGIYRGT